MPAGGAVKATGDAAKATGSTSAAGARTAPAAPCQTQQRQNRDPPWAPCQPVLRERARRHSRPGTVRARQRQRKICRCHLLNRSGREHGVLVLRSAPTERQRREQRRGASFCDGAQRATAQLSRFEYCGAAPQTASFEKLARGEHRRSERKVARSLQQRKSEGHLGCQPKTSSEQDIRPFLHTNRIRHGEGDTTDGIK